MWVPRARCPVTGENFQTFFSQSFQSPYFHCHIWIQHEKCIKMRVFFFKWGHPRNFVTICEKCFCRNLKTDKVKYIKVYNFRRVISQEIYWNRKIFGKKIVLMRIRQKVYFFWPHVFDKKEYFVKKKKNPKPCKYMYLGNAFSLCWLISYFWKFGWNKKALKNHFLAKISFFGAKNNNKIIIFF